MNVVKIVFIILFASSLAAPTALTLFNFKAPALGGVTKKAKEVGFNFKNIRDDEFQSQLEKQFSRQLPIFASLVKTDNQFSFWVFHQLSSNPKSKVVLGLDNNLIERTYLSNFNREGTIKRAELENFTNTIAHLDAALKTLGKPLIILVSTNKPSFYPEVVPDWYTRPGVQALPSKSDVLIEFLRDKAVPVFDTKQFLHQVESEIPIKLFEPTGTHWNQYASCRISSELAVQIGHALSKDVRRLQCSLAGKRGQPLDADTDLLSFSNLLFPQSLIRPAPLVKTQTSKLSSEIKPNVLFIGTSFTGELMKLLSANPIFGSREFLYYFRRQILSDGTTHPINPETFNIMRSINNSDAIVIEANEASIEKIGNGFVQQALAKLGK